MMPTDPIRTLAESPEWDEPCTCEDGAPSWSEPYGHPKQSCPTCRGEILLHSEWWTVVEPAMRLHVEILKRELAELREALGEVEGVKYHACITGDCPHDDGAVCDEEIRLAVSKLPDRAALEANDAE